MAMITALSISLHHSIRVHTRDDVRHKMLAKARLSNWHIGLHASLAGLVRHIPDDRLATRTIVSIGFFSYLREHDSDFVVQCLHVSPGNT